MNLKEELNSFFVSCFYSILNAEERCLESLSNGKLTLKEIHVIEAVFKTLKNGDNNFSTIAKKLNITLGTLTTYFAKLERKGYLTKEQDKKDKRVYYIFPTRLAELIELEHLKFHEKLTDGITGALSPTEQRHLVTALKHLDSFFESLK